MRKKSDHNSPTPKGGILYMGKYGATRQYAAWIGEATGLPVIDLSEAQPDLSQFDFLILGSAVYIGRLFMEQWLRKNWPVIKERPALLFSVSGSPPGHPDLELTLEASLTPEMRSGLEYVPLRGRLDLRKLPWWLRLMLPMVGRLQADPETRDRLMHEFDTMDIDRIKPVGEWAKQRTAKATPFFKPV